MVGSSNIPRIRRGGFTLMEAIAALVILGLAIPPMVFSLRQASIDRVDPIRFSRARFLATDKLEQIVADRHSSTRGYDYLVSGNYASENPVVTDPDFSRTVTLNETGVDLQSAGTGYMTVTVQIGWSDSKGQTRNLEISTVLTEYGS